MHLSATLRSLGLGALAIGCLAALPASATIHIKNRTVNQPLVLDQQDDYCLSKVYISGVTDVAPLTLTGKINSVTLSQCIFSNVWSSMGQQKAVAAESQGAIVGAFTAVDTAFEDAQHQLLCLREGAFGTVSFTRCRFRTTDQFLKKIYADDPWRTTPPTTEFANIDRLELIDNEYSNTILVIHPSVKLVIFRGDLTNVRLQSPGTHVIRLERNQDPSTIALDGTANAAANKPATVVDEAHPAPTATPAAVEPAAAASVIAPDGDDTTAAPVAAESVSVSLTADATAPACPQPEHP